MGRPTRREFLRNSFTAACATGITSSLSAAGLTAATVHVPTAAASPLPAEPLPIKKGADGANVRIDSVMNMDHWKYPLSSSDPAVVEKSLAGMRTSLHNAKLWGSDAVLLVPAVVNSQT